MGLASQVARRFAVRSLTAEGSSTLWEEGRGALRTIAYALQQMREGHPESADQAFGVLFYEKLKEWSDAALGMRVDPDLMKALQDVHETPTPENARKAEQVVQRIVDSLAPERFEYSGFKIRNPGHISDERVRRLLDGVDFLVALFKKRGVQKLLEKGVKQVVLNIDDSDKAVHGRYFPVQKTIHVMVRSLGSSTSRLWKDWVQEVFLHEFGHHVQMNYLSPDASADWESAWKPVEELKKQREETIGVTKEDRLRFLKLIERSNWNPATAARKLKGLDKLKMAHWLRNPSLGESLITPKSFRLTKRGRETFAFLADPKGYLEDERGESLEDERGDWYLQRRTKVVRTRLYLDDDYTMHIGPTLAAQYLADDPTIGDKALEEAVGKLGIPSGYGKTNELEDFAETWVAFMVNPEVLSDMAKYRMQRALSLSGLYGKPVLRLSVLTLRVAARYTQAYVRTIDPAWVERLRKDFLLLLKNLPRVKDYQTADEFREVVRRYRETFNKWVFDELLNPLKEEGKTHLYSIRKPAWDFYLELSNIPLSRPDGYNTEESILYRYQQEVRTWEQRLRAKAQKLWKEFKDHLGYLGDRVEVEVPDEERLVLEGFQVTLLGYDPREEIWQQNAIPLMKETLRLYRRKASQVLPWLLKKQLPLELDFKVELDKGATYEKSYIHVTMSSMIGMPPEFGVHILAHEMGHHLYKGLNPKAKEFWDTAIRQDYGPIDLRELLQAWPENVLYTDSFTDSIASKDPILSLQVDLLSRDRGGNTGWMTRERFQKAYDSGERTVVVPKHPITGYAGKSPEEAFCEAVGYLVAYGPRTVLPLVQSWLKSILPG